MSKYYENKLSKLNEMGDDAIMEISAAEGHLALKSPFAEQEGHLRLRRGL